MENETIGKEFVIKVIEKLSIIYEYENYLQFIKVYSINHLVNNFTKEKSIKIQKININEKINYELSNYNRLFDIPNHLISIFCERYKSFKMVDNFLVIYISMIGKILKRIYLSIEKNVFIDSKQKLYQFIADKVLSNESRQIFIRLLYNVCFYLGIFSKFETTSLTYLLNKDMFDNILFLEELFTLK